MMKQINNLEFQYVAATDLEARGIDIEGISHVINFELLLRSRFLHSPRRRTAQSRSCLAHATIFDVEDEDAVNKLEKMGIEFVNKDLQKQEWVSNR